MTSLICRPLSAASEVDEASAALASPGATKAIGAARDKAVAAISDDRVSRAGVWLEE